MSNPPKKDKPNFAAWSHTNLANFASDAYDRLQEQEFALEQIRLDLKDAMKLVRQQFNKDDWK
jgi:hypothetical protein